ncbi:MAG TPA: rRNA maturation RNase YbeY [Gemmatimonadales bacterium]|nr:rRNA maturation RNase YbeY [Gemmatimonadales bacterium]
MAVARRPALPPATVRRIVAAVLAGERRRAEVAVTFLGPRRMRTLNREWLGHDRVTDVIAFGLAQPDGTTVGDVYVCRAVALREARRRRIPVRQELIRLVVHGTLHVLGHDHPEGGAEARERSPMWARQERYVRRLTA